MIQYILECIAFQRPFLAKGYSALAGLARERDDLQQALEYLKLAVNEDPHDGMLYYRLCALTDRYYKDPKVKLKHYERYVNRFGTKVPYFSETAKKGFQSSGNKYIIPRSVLIKNS